MESRCKMNVRLQKRNTAILSKQIKRITALLLAVTFMIVGSGCNMNFYSEETLQKKAIKYMEKKYGNQVQFSVKKAYVEGDTYNVYLDVKEHEGWKVLACWDYVNKKFTDNYMSWVFQEQVEETFYPLFSEVYGSCKIFNGPYGFQISDLYNYDTKLEDYLSTVTVSNFCLFITSDIKKKEEDLQKLCNLIDDSGWEANVTIMYVTEETFLKIERLNYKEILKNKNFIWCTNAIISKNKENFIGQWSKGKLNE